jgi:hypothetical protein
MIFNIVDKATGDNIPYSFNEDRELSPKAKLSGLHIYIKDAIGYSFEFNHLCSITMTNCNNCTVNMGDNCMLDARTSCSHNTFTAKGECSFMVGSNCTFKTGSHCIFNTWDKCKFRTAHSCIFYTSSNCSFTTHGNCSINCGDLCHFSIDRHSSLLNFANNTISLNKLRSCSFEISGDDCGVVLDKDTNKCYIMNKDFKTMMKLEKFA